MQGEVRRMGGSAVRVVADGEERWTVHGDRWGMRRLCAMH